MYILIYKNLNKGVLILIDMTDTVSTKVEMLVWDNGFYYPYTRGEDGKAKRVDTPIVPETLEVIAETPIQERFDYVGTSQDQCIVQAFRILEGEALKYAELKSHNQYVTLDDHRNPEEKSTKIGPLQAFEYEVTGRVLLLKSKEHE
jgi:hypothetical protein